MSQATSALTLDDVRARREEINRAADEFGARNVHVFGSVARGQADERSDFDLLVDLDESPDGFAYFGRLEDFRRAVEKIVERNVHVVDRGGLRKLNERTSREAVQL